MCKACPRLSKYFDFCTKCGCHMPTKARIEIFKCPLDKWDKEASDKS